MQLADAPDASDAAANVRLQAALLRRSPVVASLVREGRPAVVGGVFELASGRVRLVDPAA